MFQMPVTNWQERQNTNSKKIACNALGVKAISASYSYPNPNKNRSLFALHKFNVLSVELDKFCKFDSFFVNMRNASLRSP